MKSKTLAKPEAHAAGSVVADYFIGHTHIRIHDDCYRNKSKEDIDKILEQVSQTVARAYCY